MRTKILSQVVFCLVFIFAITLYGEDYSHWNYYKNIYINTTSEGADVNEDVSDFPLLIRLTSNNFDFSEADSNGADIRFSQSDGMTPLSYEIERWDSGNKIAEIWVRTDVLGNNDQQYITMYWDNDVPSESDGATVFETSNSFVGVWHLNDAARLDDATSNDNTATNSGTENVSGISSNAVNFDGQDYIDISPLAFSSVDNKITVELWQYGNPTAQPQNNRLVWAMQTENYRTLNIIIPWSDEDIVFDAGNYVSGGNSYFQRIHKLASSPSQYEGQWNHWVFTKNANEARMRMYLNGELWHYVDTSKTYPINIDYIFRLGADHNDDLNYNGYLDEFRVSNNERSASWIKLSYETQKLNQNTVQIPENYNDWIYSKKLYLNTTNSGANVLNDVLEFPLLVRLDSANFVFAQAKSDGSDLRFTNSSGVALEYEIENWDRVNNKADLWIKIDRVYGDNKTQYVTMFWGNTNAQSSSNPEGVFDVNNSFAGVWHFNESLNDATSNNNDYSNNGTSSLDGVVSKGRFFNGDSNHIDLPSPSTSLNALDTFSVSMWAETDDNTNGYQTLISLHASDTDRTYMSLWNETSGIKVYNDLDNAGVTAAETNWLPQNNTWFYVTWIIDGDNWKVYIDGALESSSSQTLTIDDLDDDFLTRIGRRAGWDDAEWEGTIDEVRISSKARSEDWIQLSYETQKLHQSCVSFSSFTEEITAPSNFNANAVNNDIVLSWIDNSNNEDGFEIYYGSDLGSMQLLDTTNENITTYTHTIGACDISYYYSIKAFNDQYVSQTVTLQNKAYTTPCVPTNIQANAVSDNVISVTWSGNSYQYILVSSFDSANWVEIYRGNNKSFSHTGLTCNQYVEYKVKGITPDSVTSDFSAIASATTQSCPLSNPTNMAADNGIVGQITLSWTDNSDNELGFKLFKSEEGGSFVEVSNSIPANGTSHIDSNVTSGYSYRYFVKAYNMTNTSGSSDTVEVQALFFGADKKSTDLITITDMLYDTSGNPITDEKIIVAKLFTNIEGNGTPVYEEAFNDVAVKNGYFLINLGLTNDVASVIRAYKSLFFDIIIDGQSIYGTLLRPLAASPYAIKNSYNLSGTGSPVGTVAAPIGAFYVDITPDNYKLYIKYGVSDNDWIPVNN